MSVSPAYSNFRAWVPRKRLTTTPLSNSDWIYYDWGPRNYSEPLICIHDALGSADVFYHQIISLAPLGYRVIAVTIPSCSSLQQFATAFHAFLDTLRISKCHVYGTGLGGFLALAAAAECDEEVKSLILTHTWVKSETVRERIKNGPGVIRLMPDFMIRGILKTLAPVGKVDKLVAESVYFVRKQTFNEKSKEPLLSRLLLYTTAASFEGNASIPRDKITILDTLDRTDPLASRIAQELSSAFPQARLALLKDGGEHPYIACPDQVNMHLIVHLRRYAPPPADRMPLPPPAYIAPTRSEDNVYTGSTEGVENTEIETEAKAVAAKEQAHRIEVYSNQISVLKTSFPDFSDAFLAAVLDDNKGDTGRSIQKIANDDYEKNYEHVIFDRAVEEFRAKHIVEEDEGHGTTQGSDRAPRTVIQQPEKHTDGKIGDKTVSHRPNKSISSKEPHEGLSQSGKQGSDRDEAPGSVSNDNEQVNAYLTSAKGSTRKTPLVSRGPMPFPSTPRKRSPSTISDSPVVSREAKRGADSGTKGALSHKSRNSDGGGIYSRAAANESDEWSHFREHPGGPLFPEGSGKTTLEEADRSNDELRQEVDEERLKEWTTAASNAIGRRKGT